MPAGNYDIEKFSHQRKKALIRERTGAGVVLQADWINNSQEMLKLHLSTGCSLTLVKQS